MSYTAAELLLRSPDLEPPRALTAGRVSHFPPLFVRSLGAEDFEKAASIPDRARPSGRVVGRIPSTGARIIWFRSVVDTIGISSASIFNWAFRSRNWE